MKAMTAALLACLMALPMQGKVKTTEKNFADTIQIKYIGGQVLVPITIKGKTYDFVYDTGANVSQVPDSLVSELMLKVKSNRSVSGYASQSSKMAIGPLAEMTIGNIHLNGVTGSGGGPDSFVLGAFELYLYGGITAKLDLQKGILILTDQKNFFKGEAGHELPQKAFGAMASLYYTMSYGAGKKAALFDTGNNSYFVLGRKAFNESAKGATGEDFLKQVLWSDTLLYTGYTGQTIKQEQTTMLLKELKLGDLTFLDVPTHTIDGTTGFGCRMLEYGSAIMTSTSVIFQPYTEGNTIQLHAHIPQLSLNFLQNNLLVRRIAVTSQLYADGVREGDLLVEMGGHPVTTVDSFATVLRQLGYQNPIPLKFRRPDGTDYTVTAPALSQGLFFEV